jgi:hypothetical protein
MENNRFLSKKKKFIKLFGLGLVCDSNTHSKRYTRFTIHCTILPLIHLIMPILVILALIFFVKIF